MSTGAALQRQRYVTAAIACVCLACLTSSQNILIKWSQFKRKEYTYNVVTVTFMVELVKFVMAWFFLLREQSQLANAPPVLDSDETRVRRVDLRAEFSWLGFQQRLPYALPALIYFAKNNLVFYGMKYMSPVTYQLLGNMKILTTTLLFRIVMARPLNDLAWLSMLLLTLGLTCTQLKTDTAVSVSVGGFLIMVAISLLSASGGIVTEWLMKSNKKRAAESLHIQNIWLYFYGMLFNFVAALSDDFEGITTKGFFYGYSLVTLCIIFNNSCSGIAVSAIMKYANNLIKLFTFAVSLIITTVLCYLFFEFELTPPFIVGSLIVCCAIYLYSTRNKTRT